LTQTELGSVLRTDRSLLIEDHHVGAWHRSPEDLEFGVEQRSVTTVERDRRRQNDVGLALFPSMSRVALHGHPCRQR
jgi:hypothetical protein